MSLLVIILGDSGAGKSSGICKNGNFGIEGLNPSETVMFNCGSKRLIDGENAFEYNNKNGNYVELKNPETLVKGLIKLKEKPEILNIVIDDFQYLFADLYREGTTGSVWDLYKDIFEHFYDILTKTTELRNDQIVYLLSHVESYNESAGKPSKRMKVIGQAINKYITPEGLSNIVLYAEGRIEAGVLKKFYRTEGDGISDTCKSPSVLFRDDKGKKKREILNDLGLVNKEIREKIISKF